MLARIMMLDIIDVGMGNIYITNALARLGLGANVISDPNHLRSNTLILPGGSAQPFMQKIRSSHFDTAIYDHVKKGNKIMGICLGFQVMIIF